MIDPVQQYLNEVKATCKYFSREEELALAAAYDGGKGDKSAGQSLVKAVLPMVVKVAKKYRGPNRRDELFLDLIQEGNAGAMRAAVKYRPEEFGTRFTTYAYWWIRQSISRYLKERGLIHVPVHLQDPGGDQCKYRDQAEAARFRVRSLDVGFSLGPDGTPRSFHDLIASGSPTPVEEAIRNEKIAIVRSLLKWLPGEWRTVMELRLEDLTLEECGERMGITRERVRQMESRAIGSMLRALTRQEDRRRAKSVKNRRAIGLPPILDEESTVSTNEATAGSGQRLFNRARQFQDVPNRRYFVQHGRYRRETQANGAGLAARRFLKWLKREFDTSGDGNGPVLVSTIDFDSDEHVAIPLERARAGDWQEEPLFVDRRKGGAMKRAKNSPNKSPKKPPTKVLEAVK